MTNHNGYINYNVFDPDLIPLHLFSGPKVDEKSLDFEAVTTSGKKVELSDYLGKTVVLEMGSYTCPMHNGDVEGMNRLCRKYPDVVFLVLYIREAHPGEKIAGHELMSDKIALAKKLEDNPDENRLVLVDDIEGTIHRQYGSLPNSVHVINSKGIIVFRSDWNSVDLVIQILAELEVDDAAQILIEHFPKKPPILSQNGIPVLLRGGWRAIWDMIITVPVMIKAHKRATAAYPSEKTYRG